MCVYNWEDGDGFRGRGFLNKLFRIDCPLELGKEKETTKNSSNTENHFDLSFSFSII
jgi:hypothetical protein